MGQSYGTSKSKGLEQIVAPHGVTAVGSGGQYGTFAGHRARARGEREQIIHDCEPVPGVGEACWP